MIFRVNEKLLFDGKLRQVESASFYQRLFFGGTAMFRPTRLNEAKAKVPVADRAQIDAMGQQVLAALR